MSFTTSELKAWISDRTGLDAEFLNRPWFESLMRERLDRFGLKQDARSFQRLLSERPDELQRVVQHVAVPETWFFRYPASFEYLLDHLRNLRAVGDDGIPLRMLSIACATGEEPYSMAITALSAGWTQERIRIDAVDCDPQCLEDAKSQRFSARPVRSDLPDWAKTWLATRDAGGLDPALSDCIRWHLSDAADPQVTISESPYAIIFCRNLLVYMHPAMRRDLVSRLHRWLEPQGRLFVGHADALSSVRQSFEPLAVPSAFVFAQRQRVPAARKLREDAPSRAPRPPMFQRLAPRAEPAQDQSASEPIVEVADPAEPNPMPPFSLDAARRLADEGALDEALELIQLLPPDPEIYLLEGSILLALEKTDEAKQALRRALYLNKDHEEALLQLAVLHQRLGDEEAAQRYRRRAAEVNHRNSSDRQDNEEAP